MRVHLPLKIFAKWGTHTGTPSSWDAEAGGRLVSLRPV